jgi:hypothetical protein
MFDAIEANLGFRSFKGLSLGVVAAAVTCLTASHAVAAGPVDELQTGVFSDAPVAGLRYTTSSGVSGVTDAHGQFQFKTGDLVTFALGNLTLGQGAASGTLSPVDLAGGDINKASNLYVLLQSLDTGRDPNTITLPEQVNQIDFSALRLNDAPAAFGQPTSNPTLHAIVRGLGLNHGVVTVDQAKTHARQMFWKQASGVWLLEGGEYRSIAYLSGAPLVQAPNFLTAEFAAPINASGSPGLSGVDSGGLAWNPLTYGFRPVVVDADAVARLDGASVEDAAQPSRTLRLNGAALDLSEGGTTYHYVRHPNDPKGLVGAWRLGLEGNAEDPLFGFLPNGRFVIASVGGLRCTQQGMEAGQYTWDQRSGAFHVAALTEHTTPCSSVSQQIAHAKLSDDGQTLTLTLADTSTLDLQRVAMH